MMSGRRLAGPFACLAQVSWLNKFLRRPQPHTSAVGTFLAFGLGSLFCISAGPCFGQRTVVQDAGAGKKMELVYDASDRVVETRTLDAAGKLRVRSETEYRPGYLVPQHKTTNYFSDGKTVDSVSRVTFDENGNFTGEFIVNFDQAGKQSGGTKLTHDPLTGFYRCFLWNKAAQDYQPDKCPTGEESGESGEKSPELARDQVMKELRQAREARREGPGTQPLDRQPLSPMPAPITPKAPPDIQTAPLCLKGDTCAVSGSFSGDSSKTLIAFGIYPAPIVAETESVAYFTVPPEVREGANHLIVTDPMWSGVEVLPVVVSEVSFSPNHRQVTAGSFALVHSMLAGPEAMPDDQWRAGTFAPGATLEKARKLVPGFELPREADEGTVLLVLWNESPDGLSLRASDHQSYAFKLTSDSFERGEFRYQFVVDAAKAGRFDLRGTILPFLAPVHGRLYPEP